jgi:hypothetical protein
MNPKRGRAALHFVPIRLTPSQLEILRNLNALVKANQFPAKHFALNSRSTESPSSSHRRVTACRHGIETAH